MLRRALVALVLVQGLLGTALADTAPLESGVHGRVASAAGSFLGNVALRATNALGEVVGDGRSHFDGSYSLPLPPGAYNLTFQAPGHRDHTVPVTVGAGVGFTLVDATLDVDGAVLRGTVTDAATGAPLPWTRVSVEWADPACSGGLPCPPVAALPVIALTDNDGAYALGVPPGTVHATVARTDYRERTAQREVGAEGARLDVALDRVGAPTAWLAGRVTDASTGTPLADARLHLVRGTAPGEGSEELFDRTDAQGRYRIPAAPGAYALAITAPGYAEHRAQVRLAEGQDLTVDAALRPLGAGDGADPPARPTPGMGTAFAAAGLALVAVLLARR